jgi:hypothetical protein
MSCMHVCTRMCIYLYLMELNKKGSRGTWTERQSTKAKKRKREACVCIYIVYSFQKSDERNLYTLVVREHVESHDDFYSDSRLG